MWGTLFPPARDADESVRVIEILFTAQLSWSVVLGGLESRYFADFSPELH